MNILLATIASLLLPEALTKTQAAAELQKGPKQVSDEDLALAKRLEHHFRGTNETVARMFADLLPFVDPKYKNAVSQFYSMIGENKRNATYDDFTILMSLDAYNHTIPRGETFLVTNGKERKCITVKGKITSFSNTEKDCRPATQNEIEGFFAELTQTHLIAFSAMTTMDGIMQKAVEKLNQDLTPKAKKSKTKKSSMADGIVTAPATQAVEQAVPVIP
jgi:hypothetical protein